MPKISALPNQTAPDGADELPTNDVSATTTKKMTLTILKQWFQSIAGWITTAMVGDGQITYGKFATGTIINGESIRINRTSTQSISATTLTTIQYNASVAGFDATLFELNSYGVKILSSRIKSVKVTVNCQISNTHTQVLYVYKNNSLIAAVSYPANDSNQLADITIPVSQNDIIYGKIYDATGATNITASADWNNMTVAVSAVNN